MSATKGAGSLTQIKPEDLRLGNWVIAPDGYIEVAGIGNGEVRGILLISKHLTDNAMGYGIDELKGIELSPELLEKCGAEYDDVVYTFWTEFGCVMLAENDNRFDLFINKLFEGKQGEIYYLHRLQNLTAALGQELQITL